jgi:hypothetical protein
MPGPIPPEARLIIDNPMVVPADVVYKLAALGIRQRVHFLPLAERGRFFTEASSIRHHIVTMVIYTPFKTF